MSTLTHFVIAATMVANIAPTAAQGLTEAKAREIIAPWYNLFDVATQGDVKKIQEQVLTDDYELCSGYLPGECWGRDTSIKVVGNFANSIPDMEFHIKEVLVASDRVVVRGEVTGTRPASCSARRAQAKAFALWRSTFRQSGTGYCQDVSHGELV